MRKTLMTAALLLAFSCPVFAGEIATPGSPAPPPPTSTTAQDGETLPGEIATPGLSATVTQAVLDLLAVIPALL